MTEARDLTVAATQGSDLSEEQARTLEERLQVEPNDLEARARLLGFYFLRSHSSEAARQARGVHVLWIIRNRPELPLAGLPYVGLDPSVDDESYESARKIWIEKTMERPGETAVLGNAASFFLPNDREAAERLWLQASRLEPQSPDWPEQLAHLHSMPAPAENAEARNNRASKALAYHRRALELASSEGRQAMLPGAARAAFEARDLDKARAWARELIDDAPQPGDWNHGNAIHHGHVILGRLSLRVGDIQSALEHLLAAGRTPGSPQLDSFGPSMALAHELLISGERTVVLEYFDLCARFWEAGRDELNGWAAVVRSGGVPDFGYHLLL
jgi:hypothetical protein